MTWSPPWWPPTPRLPKPLPKPLLPPTLPKPLRPPPGPPWRPKHALRTDFIDDPARARAVAEGARSTRMHSHVNEILSEELDRVESQGVRRTSHEYLRVILGGTASMPALKVEA